MSGRFKEPSKTTKSVDLGEEKKPVLKEKKKANKIFLMGGKGTGKSSMLSIVFANRLDVSRMGFKNDMGKSRVRFMGNSVLSLWDSNGGDKFYEQYVLT